MAFLPLELWQIIFLHTCTDGGYSGCSLARVSRFFRSASHPFRFNSLAFTSLLSIASFIKHIGRIPGTHTRLPKVRHLLLSFTRPSLDESSSEIDRWGDFTEQTLQCNVWYQARQTREHEKDAWDSRFIALLPDLLDLVGSNLESFALLQSDTFIIPFIRYRLPRLRELTLLVGVTVILNEDLCNSFERDLKPFAPPAHLLMHSSPPIMEAIPETSPIGNPETARFPKLERLRIMCGRHRDWTLRDALVHLPHLAPKLTHLHIRNATYTHGSHECIASFLKDAFCIPRWTQAANNIPAVSDLPHLRRVEVHSIPPPAGDRCEMSHKGYRTLVEAMESLREACDRSSKTLLRWTESDREKQQVLEDACWKYWIDAVEGRWGDWDFAC